VLLVHAEGPVGNLISESNDERPHFTDTIVVGIFHLQGSGEPTIESVAIVHQGLLLAVVAGDGWRGAGKAGL
jgi:hypothetical protein